MTAGESRSKSNSVILVHTDFPGARPSIPLGLLIGRRRKLNWKQRKANASDFRSPGLRFSRCFASSHTLWVPRRLRSRSSRGHERAHWRQRSDIRAQRSRDHRATTTGEHYRLTWPGHSPDLPDRPEPAIGASIFRSGQDVLRRWMESTPIKDLGVAPE